MSLTEKFPINVAELKKGQLLTNEQLEHILGIKRNHQEKWVWALLSLYQFIEENTDFSVKTTPEGLRILLDSEAAIYNHNRFTKNRKGMYRRYERNLRVDIEKLTAEEKAIHAHRLLNQSRYISAMTEVKHAISIGAYQRRTPGLPPAASVQPAK